MTQEERKTEINKKKHVKKTKKNNPETHRI